MSKQSAWNRIRNLQDRIVRHPDSRVARLAEEEPNAQIMAALICELLPEDAEFDFRFISPGRSGAKVIMVLFAGDRLPLIVKFGDLDLVEKERTNYETLVKNTFPPANRVELSGNLVKAEGYAAISYTWAGGRKEVWTLRDFFARGSAADLKSIVRSLLDDVIPWQAAHRGAQLPFDQWSWDPEALSGIREIISMSSLAEHDKERLSNALRIPVEWRGHLRTKQSAQGLCHGDLNARNILIAQSGNGFVPILIDFASIRSNKSPALDWAKLEREVKFRCLWDAEPNETLFRSSVKALDEATLCRQAIVANAPTLIKAHWVISEIHAQFLDRFSTVSDIPFVEYLFYLYQWSLAFLLSPDDHAKLASARSAVLESSLCAVDNLEKAMPSGTPSWEVVRTTEAQQIDKLRKTVTEARERVLDLSEQLFELESEITIAKSLFEREFATTLRQIKEFEFRTDRLHELIDYKRGHPKASMSEVEEAITASEREREEAMEAYVAELERSRRKWQSNIVVLLTPDEYRQAKALCCDLVRQVHPDLLDGPKDDPMLGRTLQMLYEMKETGYDPAKLAEIDARLRAYKDGAAGLYEEPTNEDTASTMRRLEQTAVALRERARQLRQDLKSAEADSYYRFRPLITDRTQRDRYAAELEQQLQMKLHAYDVANREFLSLFNAVTKD